MSAPFSPLRLIDGYLPIEDHGLIGDGTTAALIGRDGSLSWLSVPRFDSPPLFCRLLDAERGGAFCVAPEELVESRQFYEGDSGILVTELRSRSGLVRLTDALTLRSGADLTEDAPVGRAELLRSVSVLQGRLRLRIEVEPWGGARVESYAGGLQLHWATDPDLDLWLFSTDPLPGLCSTHELQAGDNLHLLLHWGRGSHRRHPVAPEKLLSRRSVHPGRRGDDHDAHAPSVPGVWSAAPRRALRRAHAVHTRRRGRGILAEHRADAHGVDGGGLPSPRLSARSPGSAVAGISASLASSIPPGRAVSL